VRIVVVGATGNIGTSLLRALAATEHEVVGVARRFPESDVLPAAMWVRADIESDDLTQVFRGADVVVDLAWLIQPSRDLELLESVNVGGSVRLFRAAAEAGVESLVYSSSLGAYSAGPKNDRVREDWPVGGVAASYYSRQKAAVESALDRFERERPRVRVVRMRPALVFKREAATGIRRLFVGPFLAGPMVSATPVAPAIQGLRFQCVHSDDVARAFVAAIESHERGAFNLAAEPVLEPTAIAMQLGVRPVTLSPGLARRAAAAAWHLRLTSVSPDWLNLGLAAPLMDTEAARSRLGWAPQTSATAALRELLDGLRSGAAGATPPLARETSGRGRWRELATRSGAREDVSR